MVVAGLTAMGAIAPRFMKSSDAVKHLTHTMALGSLSVTVTENGAVESSNNKEIKCLVQGGSTVLWVIETGTLVNPGDELVRLDQSKIEDKILQQRIVYETALANKITAESDVAVAEISITEYLEGSYKESRSLVEKEIFEAEQLLRKTELAFDSAIRLAAKGVLKSLQLEGEKFAVDSAQAKLASFEASLELEKTRLDREKKQLANCVIRADTAGMVIFPSMAAWKDTPDITEGAVVREQQTLLVIPDVSKMQVKVGIHESKVDRLKVGMPAKVQLQDLVLEGEVSEIAEVTRPAGWWTGNLVKYDTKIAIKPHPGLKPGMSAVVDVVLASHENVLTIPVASIVESKDGFTCWVETLQGVQQRVLQLGDTNDEFSVVQDGLAEGDQIILNPLAFVKEAQALAIQPTNRSDEKTASGNTKAESNKKELSQASNRK